MLFLQHQKSFIYAHILPKTQEKNRFADEHFVLDRDSLPFLKDFFNSTFLHPSRIQGSTMCNPHYGRCADNAEVFCPKTLSARQLHTVLAIIFYDPSCGCHHRNHLGFT